MWNGCDGIIQERNIQDPHSNCKKKNTFILHPVENVIPVCTGGKMIYGTNFVKSIATFRTVLCTLIGEDKTKKTCKYNSSPEKEEHIVIACENGKPVHFEDPNKYSHISLN